MVARQPRVTLEGARETKLSEVFGGITLPAPPLKEMPPPLRRALLNKRLSLFLGAGAGICRQLDPSESLPTARTMLAHLLSKYFQLETPESLSEGALTRLATRFREEQRIPDAEQITFERVWGIVFTQRRNQLVSFINDITELVNHHRPVPPNYRYVAWLHANGFLRYVLTTNFDELIDAAYRTAARESEKVSFVPATSPYDFKAYDHEIEGVLTLHKLHGTISSPHTISVGNQGASFADEWSRERDAALVPVLERVLKESDAVVFVGYSFADDDVKKLFQQLVKGRLTAEDFQGKVWWIDQQSTTENRNAAAVLDLFQSAGNEQKLDSLDFLRSLYSMASRQVDFESSYGFGLEREFLRVQDVKSLPHAGKEHSYVDPVYGELKFGGEVAQELSTLVDFGDNQRLRGIRHLSFSQVIYPGATHTRFSHALGTAYLAWRATERLKTLDETGLTRRRQKTLVLSAFLHDIGHGPLSHVIDKFHDRLGESYSHEQRTAEIIRGSHLDFDHNWGLMEQARDEIIELLSSSHPQPDREYQYQLIRDYGLDLDRVDFLLRDLHFTGYPFQWKSGKSTLVERQEALIAAMGIGEFGGRRVLTFDRSRAEPLLHDFLDLYYEMYSRVYWGPQVASAEAMIARALHLAHDLGDLDKRRLHELTDSGLLRLLEHESGRPVRELAYGVKYRRFFEEALTVRWENPEKAPAIAEFEHKLESVLGMSGTSFDKMVIVSRIPLKDPKELYWAADGEVKPVERLAEIKRRFAELSADRILVSPKSLRLALDRSEDLKKCIRELDGHLVVKPRDG